MSLTLPPGPAAAVPPVMLPVARRRSTVRVRPANSKGARRSGRIAALWQVVLRDVDSLDDLGEATAPAPIEPGDLVATVDAVYRVEVIIGVSAEARCVPALASLAGRADEAV